jgi:vancomycin resistance protein YoaR
VGQQEGSPRIFSIPLAHRPYWIAAVRSPFGIRATLDARWIRAFLEQTILPTLVRPEHLQILALPEPGKSRAVTEGKMRDGWTIDPGSAAREIAEGVQHGLLSFTLPAAKAHGEIRNETGKWLGSLTLLARGRSNFAKSSAKRIHNIRKALEEHISNTLVAAGETVSFNDLFEGPIEVWNGWELELGIFNNGATLQPTPGGGICQTSTTTFRALVAAGLPIIERANHSRYINYYRSYGEGLDAAVFRGSKDLVFQNDTPSYLLLQARTEGEDAIVEIYGTPDGRTVALEGPFRRNNAPADLELQNGRKLGNREIVWRQHITHADGTVEEKILRSVYQSDIPATPSEKAAEVEVLLGPSLL